MTTTPIPGPATIDRIAQVIERIEQATEPVGVAELATEVGWSRAHLSREFRARTGTTITAYQQQLLADRARAALRAGRPVLDAVHESGHGSVRQFYEHSAPRLGVTPSQYRDGAHRVTIRWTLVPTDLGDVFVAATDRGVCRIAFDATEHALVAEYPAASIVRDDDALASVAHTVRALAAGEAPDAALPIDVQASAFTAAVWDAVRTIPRGETRTYSQIAAQVGRPGASRAVGRAVGANRVALAIPCHRVVREDGGLGGYRWGVDRKDALLQRERRD